MPPHAGPWASVALPTPSECACRRLSAAAPSHESLCCCGRGGGCRSDSELAFDPFHSLEPVLPESTTEVAERARQHELQPLTKHDCLEFENFDPDVNKAVWDRVNKLRLQKVCGDCSPRQLARAPGDPSLLPCASCVQIESELACRHQAAVLLEMQSHLQVLKVRYDAAKAAVEKAELDREKLLQSRELAGANLELLIRVKQGQDEMESDTVVTDYSDALLIPRTSVETINSEIVKLGTERVSVLNKTKDFKKQINLQKWEQEFLTMQAGNQEEHYTDLHMLRVTKELQTLIKGGEFAQKQKKELEKVRVWLDSSSSCRGCCRCCCCCCCCHRLS